MFEVLSNTCSRLARGPAADEGVCPTLDAAVANPLSDEHWGKAIARGHRHSTTYADHQSFARGCTHAAASLLSILHWNDFVLNADRVETLRTHLNPLAERMRTVAPYLKAAGKFTGKPLPEALGLATEKLPNIPSDPRKLRDELGEMPRPSLVQIELRRTLHEILETLDAMRS